MAITFVVGQAFAGTLLGAFVGDGEVAPAVAVFDDDGAASEGPMRVAAEASDDAEDDAAT